jgi:hydroxymethylpyrimidine pyrophosphatase-like HAD family hydrolase
VKLRVLALDYDGTIAESDTLDGEVRDAIAELRAKGLVVVLVTGRILSDLRSTGLDLRLFDAAVVENGAVLVFPQAGRSSQLAARCSPVFVKALRDRGIEFREGTCVVELDAARAGVVLEIVRSLQLPLVSHFNRDRLMVLPQAISKGTGLREALRAMRLSAHNALGIGDAENDHELLALCEVGAAVAWGSPALRAAADVIVPGEGPSAVAGFIRTVSEALRMPASSARRNLVLGRDADGAVVSLAIRGRNVLVAGDPRSGKSWIGGLLCEQLILQGYCLCLIDPEGDYGVLGALPGVLVLGGEDDPPTMHGLAHLLAHADTSVVIDLSRLSLRDKRNYTVRALRTLASLRRETGLPHRIVVDEAHYFLAEDEAAQVIDSELAGYMFVTYRLTNLHADILGAADCVLITHETDAAEVRLLHGLWRGSESVETWERTLGSLALDEVVVLPDRDAAAGVLRRIRLAPRLTHHVRHRHKYLDVPVGRDVGFRFVLDDGTRSVLVCSLQEMVDALATLPGNRIRGHVRRADISRWIEEIFHDRTLAGRIREFEQRFELGSLPDFNGAAMHAIQERYGVQGAPV